MVFKLIKLMIQFEQM